MTEGKSGAGRFRRAGIAACVALLGLAACQSAQPIGESGSAASAGVVHLTKIRTSYGLPPLVPDAKLERAALQQAQLMARKGRMTHTTGWGADFNSRMKSNGINGASAENVARGRIGAGEVFRMWMNSPGHRRNMLNPNYRRFGLSYVYEADGSGRRYWALVLGS